MNIKKTIPPVILLILLVCCNSPNVENSNAFTGNIKVDINSLLPEGEIIADIMDSAAPNPRMLALGQKFIAAIKENSDWYADYMKSIPPGQPMPYNEKMGVTKEEYQELLAFKPEEISSGKAEIQIIKDGDLIRFTSAGKLAFLSYLKINLTDTTVLLGNYTIHYAGFEHIDDSTNAFKSKWKGYRWTYTEPKDLDPSALKDISHLSGKDYGFTLGQIEKGHKNFMLIKGLEIENGKKIVSFELPIIF